MRHLTRNIILSVVVLAVCLLNVIPPEENLRLGKDLAGGVSLVYSVDVKPDDPPDTISRTIDVLKDRVNPRGLFEIDFRQQGRDQIEITMPLPNERVNELRRGYERELQKIHDYEIDADAFQLAMRQEGEARESAIRAMMDTDARRALLQPVLDGIGAAATARAAYDASASAPEEERTKLLEAAGQAEVALDAARTRVLASLVSYDDLRAKLELSNEPNVIRDTKTKQVVKMPSPRELAITGLTQRVSTMPGGAELIASITKTHDDYAAQRKSLDDPSDLQRLLRGSGVLTFRIAVTPGALADEPALRQQLRERGPDAVESRIARWFPLSKLEGWYDSIEDFNELKNNTSAYMSARYRLAGEVHDGQIYVLLHDEPGLRLTRAEGNWSLVYAGTGTDELGRPCIVFRTDTVGQRLMGDMTENNVNRPMAVLLDDQVYTAPNLISRIPGDGRITGVFTTAEIDYIVKTMSAGSLQAKLGTRPLSVSTQGPELGRDNLDRGLKASYISFIAVGIFMVVYYFVPGIVAVFGMLATGLMVLGAMSLQQAAFTLPGIAGIALTFGMAVDSNVLIYERIREEVLRGRDARTALRLAYQRASTAIIDSNITTLLTAVILGYVGTPEIKGFAVSLGIGVVATMFMALIISRVILVIIIDRLNFEPAKLSLPIVIPFIQRLLSPNVRWLGYRYVFWAFSLALVAMGVIFMGVQGSKMLDSEFRGGTTVTLDFVQPAEPGQPRLPLKMTRAQVEERVQSLIDSDPAYVELLSADILPINADDDGVTSNRFLVRTTITDSDKLGQALVGLFQNELETTPALRFTGAESADVKAAPVFPIYESSLGANINRPEVRNEVERFVGGAAIVLEGLDANASPVSRDDLVRRLEHVRRQGVFPAAVRRDSQLIVVDGTPTAVKTAVLVVSDPRVNAFDRAKWENVFAAEEWALARESLTTASTLAGVQSFSPQIAQSFRAQAIIATVLSFLAITIYVWFRFGSVRYAAAALVPLVHDVVIVIGMIALAEVLYESFPALANIGIRPYKIDMGMVAAVMTIIGYSLNDTIVVLDRIRENRGKLAYASAEVINRSINETMSRTIITGGGVIFTLIVILIMGGQGIASFAYTLLVGVLIGTYSSFAIAAPFVWVKNPPASSPFHTPDPEPAPGTGLATT